MNILAMNTSFSESYVAVKSDTESVYKHMDSSLKQSENILGLVDTCLGDAKIDVQQLDVISCVIGPGSFTGIRIGVSLCKGICTALSNIKKVEINSLDLLAYTYSKQNPDGDFWTILNALSGNLFACKYNKLGERLLEPCMLSGENLEQVRGVVVGLEEEHLGLCNKHVKLSSEDLMEYTLHLIENGSYAKDFIPVYLRKSQAEAELDKKNGSN